MTILFACLFSLSFLANVVIIIIWKKTRKTMTTDCADLLRDLLVNGTAVIKIDRISTEDIFLRARK